MTPPLCSGIKLLSVILTYSFYLLWPLGFLYDNTLNEVIIICKCIVNLYFLCLGM